jgi:AcrR family transcriptional regulator
VTLEATFEHRDGLIGAASDEFLRQGYEGGSLNRILVNAGMSKGQFYHHFTGKEDLFLALAAWAIAEKRRWFEANVRVDPRLDFFDYLGAMIGASLAFTRERPDIDLLGRVLLAERGRPIFERLTERVGFRPDGAFGDLIANRHAAGELAGLPVEVMQRLVPLLLNHLPELFDLTEPASLDRQLELFTSWLRQALGPPD